MKGIVLALLLAGSAVEIVESPGSPVAIESASLDLDAKANSVLRFQARSSEPVESFKVRVGIYDPVTGRPRGFTSRVMGSAAAETQAYAVPLEAWFIDGERIRVSVVPRGKWDALSYGTGPECGTAFCVEERKSCISMCGAGCVSRFTCKMGASCESDCFCKETC
jgi:hypothetical protein